MWRTVGRCVCVIACTVQAIPLNTHTTIATMHNCNHPTWQELQNVITKFEDEYTSTGSVEESYQQHKDYLFPTDGWHDFDNTVCPEGSLSYASLVLSILSERYNHEKNFSESILDNLHKTVSPLSLRNRCPHMGWPLFNQTVDLFEQAFRRISPFAEDLLTTDPLPKFSENFIIPPPVISPIVKELMPTIRDTNVATMIEATSFFTLKGKRKTIVDVGALDGEELVFSSVAQGHEVLAFEPDSANRVEFLHYCLRVNMCDRVRIGEVNTEANTVSWQRGDKIIQQLGVELPSLPPDDSPEAIAAGEYDPCVWLLPLALGRRTGGKVQLKAKHIRSSVLDSAFNVGPNGENDVMQVPMFAGDDALSLFPFHVPFVDVLKIDVEGFEFAVMQGFKELIGQQKARYLLIEWAPILLWSAATDPMRILEWVRGMGYMCYAFTIDHPHTFAEFIHKFDDLEHLPVYYPPSGHAFDDLFCELLNYKPTKITN